ncbi:type IV pilus assembly protein PilM [Desulfoferrobacter suflitae]|uniref:type IV pilus assembly protein PilM n=1 Tax=Desulfoferrobacter suflitae TaxID=2865782 RepID=UPI0021642FEE|nr:type IV pilus assembly protein PilM [Desulfoferrobacter suflitae]MCK8601343.1 type IV pilus assembly protein PilM [Desulfoferrobacter suflitae]
MLRKKENLIGLDIGSHSIKMVRLKEKNGIIQLLNAGVVPTGPESLSTSKGNRQERLAKTIQKLAAHLKVKGKLIAMSISGYEVMIKKIELPMMTEEELEDRMHLELGQYIPYNIDEVEVDYQILDVAKDRPSFMEVLLVAAKKESINDYIDLARMAGFEPTVIDVDFFALGNAYEASYGLTGSENILLMDIGAAKTAMNVLHHGVPIFTRDVPIGGRQITEAIQESAGISEEAAERIKLGEPSPKIRETSVQEVFADVVSNWVSEFKRAVDFYYRNYPDNQIEKIFLSGGSSRISGLAGVFREGLGIPVEILNPLKAVNYEEKYFDPSYLDYLGPQMCIAFGLALRKNVEK